MSVVWMDPTHRPAPWNIVHPLLSPCCYVTWEQKTCPNLYQIIADHPSNNKTNEKKAKVVLGLWIFNSFSHFHFICFLLHYELMTLQFHVHAHFVLCFSYSFTVSMHYSPYCLSCLHLVNVRVVRACLLLIL